MSETKEMRVLDLDRDMDFYPRSKLDGMNVSKLADALKVGAELPPVIADRKSLKVVDGFHRCEAHLRVYGDEAVIQVELRDYDDENELLLEAGLLNHDHGKALTSYDQDVFATKAQARGIPIERIAMTLSIPAEKLKRRLTISGPVERRPGIFDPKPVPLKRDFRHLEGQQLDQAALEALAKSQGAGVLYSARDVIRRVESNTINWENEGVRKTLAQLRDLLNATAELPEAA